MSSAKVSSKVFKTIFGKRSYQSIVVGKKSLWTADHIVTSPFPDVQIPNKTITDHIWNRLDRWADKTAVICGITNRSYTYYELYKQSHNFAVGLRSKFKIKDGDVVCIMMPNTPEYCTAVLGGLTAGAEVTTVNPNYTSYEVHRQLSLAEPKLIIGSAETLEVLKETLRLLKRDIPIIVVTTPGEGLPPNTVSFNELAQDNNADYIILREVQRKPEDVALLPYSSGTTGMPKGVELTNRSVVSNLVQSDDDTSKFYKDTTDSYQDSVLAMMPFYHIYGLSVIMLHKLSVGTKLVTLPKFHPKTFLDTVFNHKVNLLCTVPSLISFLGAHPDATQKVLESLDTVTCGAAPLPKNDIDRFLEKTKPGIRFTQLYGMTEASPLVTTDIQGTYNYMSAGYALPNTELKIVDSNHNSLGFNQTGELLIRGPQIMKGYRNNIEATNNSISEDGWFSSGDLATIDENGALYVVDRIKELIKVKGYQVAPAELETVLREHPDISDAAVLGVPDEKAGEVPRAFVVLKNGAKVDAENIKDFVKQKVTDYKWIKEITFVDEVPRNPSGKILRRNLKEQYC